MAPPRVYALALSVALAACPSVAHAAGVVKLRASDAQEAAGGTWRLFMTISLAKPPAMAHVPMKFVFTETVRFERALVDGSDDPQILRVPAPSATPLIEVVDVGFGDGRGKVFKDSRYDLLVNRERGFEAGEWKLQVRDADGREVGSALNLVLKGENEIVNRRSMTFTAKDPAKKKSKDARIAATDAPGDGADGETRAEGPPPPFVDPSAHGKIAEEEIKVKKNGCGCAVAGRDAGAVGGTGALAGIALLASTRRRRRP